MGVLRAVLGGHRRGNRGGALGALGRGVSQVVVQGMKNAQNNRNNQNKETLYKQNLDLNREKLSHSRDRLDHAKSVHAARMAAKTGPSGVPAPTPASSSSSGSATPSATAGHAATATSSGGVTSPSTGRTYDKQSYKPNKTSGWSQHHLDQLVQNTGRKSHDNDTHYTSDAIEKARKSYLDGKKKRMAGSGGGAPAAASSSAPVAAAPTKQTASQVFHSAASAAMPKPSGVHGARLAFHDYLHDKVKTKNTAARADLNKANAKKPPGSMEMRLQHNMAGKLDATLNKPADPGVHQDMAKKLDQVLNPSAKTSKVKAGTVIGHVPHGTGKVASVVKGKFGSRVGSRESAGSQLSNALKHKELQKKVSGGLDKALSGTSHANDNKAQADTGSKVDIHNRPASNPSLKTFQKPAANSPAKKDFSKGKKTFAKLNFDRTTPASEPAKAAAASERKIHPDDTAFLKKPKSNNPATARTIKHDGPPVHPAHANLLNKVRSSIGSNSEKKATPDLVDKIHQRRKDKNIAARTDMLKKQRQSPDTRAKRLQGSMAKKLGDVLNPV